jgi:hypothetical protein
MLVLVGSSISVRGMLRARGAMTGMAVVALADALVGGAAILGAARAGASLATLVRDACGREPGGDGGGADVRSRRPAFVEGRRAIRRLVGVAAPLAATRC